MAVFFTPEEIQFPIISSVAGVPSLVLPSTTHAGPTDTSNWVIEGRVLAGSYPGDICPVAAKQKIDSLLSVGVTTFLCLQDEYELARFASYWPAIEELLSEKNNTSTVEFEHFPIPDMNVGDTEELAGMIESLVTRLKNGACVYIHCWGGHGRTGTVVGALLGRLYPLTPNQALQLTYQYHKQRKVTRGNCSPQSLAQCNQVSELVVRYYDLHNTTSDPLCQQ